MAIEIERRFLVVNDSWKGETSGTQYRQGYLYFQTDGVLRIRIAGDKGFLTVKVLKDALSALEYEYEIPGRDAKEMLTGLCKGNPVEKMRYHVIYAGMAWDIDVFSGDNEGLVIAEIELKETGQEISLPPWVGEEVTGQKKYLNAFLFKNPYTKW